MPRVIAMEDQRSPDRSVSGEQALVTAIFTRILQDARSPIHELREDVTRFVEAGGLAWWDHFLAQGGELERALRAARTRGGLRLRRPKG
jgi:hypothetical protein